VSTFRDATWATFFAANIHFARTATDYFAQGAPPSPVQHFWTLAVEEQFYIAWPVMLILGLAVIGRLTRSRGDGATFAAVAVFVGAIIVASFAWGVHETHVSPNAAYFSTFARAWELGIGALLAVSASRLAHLPEQLRAFVGWAGLVAIAIAAVEYSSGSAFPGYAALLPVLGSAAVISSGLGSLPRNGPGLFLNRAPMRLVGDVSYSFYLWHWPFLVLAADWAGHSFSVWGNVAILGIAFVVSLLSY
jgi:peptidoglycan/LPS O-acetylase OafA/YrhL